MLPIMAVEVKHTEIVCPSNGTGTLTDGNLTRNPKRCDILCYFGAIAKDAVKTHFPQWTLGIYTLFREKERFEDQPEV